MPGGACELLGTGVEREAYSCSAPTGRCGLLFAPLANAAQLQNETMMRFIVLAVIKRIGHPYAVGFTSSYVYFRGINWNHTYPASYHGRSACRVDRHYCNARMLGALVEYGIVGSGEELSSTTSLISIRCQSAVALMPA